MGHMRWALVELRVKTNGQLLANRLRKRGIIVKPLQRLEDAAYTGASREAKDSKAYNFDGTATSCLQK
jgi:hypothetical protein